MAVSNIFLVGLMCVVAFGYAAPQNGEPTRARAKPFGHNPNQREEVARVEFRPSQKRDFYQSDVQQVAPGQRTKVIRVQDNERRVIPSAPIIGEDKETKQGKGPVFAAAKNQQHAQVVQRTHDSEEELFRQQAEGAHYSFATSVDDGINGHAHSRSETRDGLAVQGMYSYSDGFFRRTVHYEADDKGYRIVKEESEPIGDGPIIDPRGQASVRSSLGTEYTITADDIQDIHPVKQEYDDRRQ